MSGTSSVSNRKSRAETMTVGELLSDHRSSSVVRMAFLDYPFLCDMTVAELVAEVRKLSFRSCGGAHHIVKDENARHCPHRRDGHLGCMEPFDPVNLELGDAEKLTEFTQLAPTTRLRQALSLATAMNAIEPPADSDWETIIDKSLNRLQFLDVPAHTARDVLVQLRDADEQNDSSPFFGLRSETELSQRITTHTLQRTQGLLGIAKEVKTAWNRIEERVNAGESIAA